MRLPKALSSAVNFAHWCQREGQEPAATARLIVLARRAAHQGEVYCNTGERSRYEKAMSAFEAAAHDMGYSCYWPGLYPVLHRNGHDVYLPE